MLKVNLTFAQGGSTAPNHVAHFETGCVNTGAQRKFYGELFDWEITPTSEDWYYGPVQQSEGGIGGGISDSGEDPPRPMITLYVMVGHLRAYLDKAARPGDTEVLTPMDMEVNDSKFSVAGFVDPRGNYIGLFHNGEG